MLEPRETSNWRAFEFATAALRDMDASTLNSPPDRLLLESARAKLDAAVAEDPDFLRARYYAAVVDDLLGESKKAAATLEFVVRQKSSFRSEAEYNLAVAHYHSFGETFIGQAILEFRSVSETTGDPLIRLLARAGIVRCHAMKVLFSGRKRELGQADDEFRAARLESASVLEEIRSKPTDANRKKLSEVEWRVLNGRGVAYMFRTDYHREHVEEDLRKALGDFSAADRLSPKNWEIVCNLGSANMRLSHLYQAENHPEQASTCFRLAAQYLTDVIERLRPGYGFALYELGRLERIAGKRDIAVHWFMRALNVPDDVRDVSRKSVEAELIAAEQGDRSFPLS
jgi:tetratricopeptide (TPR) repeat protein